MSRQVAFREQEPEGTRGPMGETQTFRRLPFRGHSTPHRRPAQWDEFTPTSNIFERLNPQSPLHWDHGDLGANFRAPVVQENIPANVNFRQNIQPVRVPATDDPVRLGQPTYVDRGQQLFCQPNIDQDYVPQTFQPTWEPRNWVPPTADRPQQSNLQIPQTRLDCQPTYQPTLYNSHVSARTSRKPPDFDGSGSFHDFLVQFELIAEMNCWDQSAMAIELAASLRGSAVAILSDLQPSERRNYGQLVFALKTRFEPDNQTQLYRAQLKTRIRRNNETLPELAQDIRKLVRLSNPVATSDIRESLAKDSFVDALNDRDLEFAVFQSQAQNLNDALRAAVEFEAFRGSRQRKLPATNFREQRVMGEESSLVMKLDEICARIEKLEQSSSRDRARGPDKSTMKCYYCGKPGHFKRDCSKWRAVIQSLNEKKLE